MMIHALLFLALLARPERPHDPWVFRSVLDGRPRMLTVALDEELWVAYDATTCGLYKAWSGGVRFQGAVHDGVHGPQPESFGESWVLGYDEPSWEASTAEGPLALEARWKGYRFDAVGVHLVYELVLESGATVQVVESPLFLRPEERWDEGAREELGLFAGDVGFLRFWRAEGIPEGVRIALRLRTDGARSKLSGLLERERIEERELEDGRRVTEVHSWLVLGAQRPLNHLLLCFEPRAEPAEAGGER